MPHFFHVNIPTYRRTDKQITLTVLREIGYPEEFIHVYVQDAGEAEEIEARYGVRPLLVEASNIGEKRDAMRAKFYSLFGRVPSLQLDDDILGFHLLSMEKTLVKIAYADDLNKLCGRFFQYTQKLGGIGWGTYPVHNAFYMDHSVSRRGLMTGWGFGILPNDIPFAREGLRFKDDYVFSCYAIRKYGYLPRFNFITLEQPKTRVGGVYATVRSSVSEERKYAHEYLLREFPDILRNNTKRESEEILHHQRSERADMRFFYGGIRSFSSRAM